MRIAIVSDIHGNFTALQAVIADLEGVSPDLIFHGGDLADAGSSPVEVVDYIRHADWPGVMGNTDEMLIRPESLEKFAAQSSAPPAMWSAIRQMADYTRIRLGPERLAWLCTMPATHVHAPVALVHASPQDPWRAPRRDATDAELEQIYGSLGQRIVVHGHTHLPGIRVLDSGRLIANSGSVGMPHDGDLRACYLLIDEGVASVRRVAYDLEKELDRLADSGLPHAEWTAKMLRSATPQLP